MYRRNFKSICRNGVLPEELYFQEFSDNEPHYSEGFIRIRLKNTLCVIPYHKERGYRELGVFLDIFPYDALNTLDIKKIKSFRKRCSFVEKCFANKIAIRLPTLKSKIVHFLLAFVSKNKILKSRNKTETKYSGKELKCYVATYSRYKVEKSIFPWNLFENREQVIFRGQKFYVCSNYKRYLTIIYGDFMQLPPVSERIAHAPLLIQTNDNYK